jgi:putative transposase
VIPFYAFPADVRRIVYITNAIEALNAKRRRAVRARGHFPSDESALKLLFLVLNLAERGWRMPPREWAMAKAQLASCSKDVSRLPSPPNVQPRPLHGIPDSPPFYPSRPPSSARLLYGKLLLLVLKSTQGISRTPIHLGNPG